MSRVTVKNWLLVAAWLFGSLSAVNADVPPEPGFKRISMNLIVKVQEDFPDHRFFIKSGADVNEISLKKGDQQTIESLGGGAWYRGGVFIAVPKKSLEGLNDAPAGGKLSELQKAVYDGKAVGMIELIKHGFTREVRESEAAGWQDPVYSIESDPEKGLKAVLISGGERENQADSGTGIGIYSREPKSGLFWGTVVGGSLMTLAFITMGVWFIRRSKVKAV